MGMQQTSVIGDHEIPATTENLCQATLVEQNVASRRHLSPLRRVKGVGLPL